MIKMITVQNQWVVNADENQEGTTKMVYVTSHTLHDGSNSIVMPFRIVEWIGSIKVILQDLLISMPSTYILLNKFSIKYIRR